MSKTIKTIVLFSFSKIVIRKVLFSSVNKNLLGRFSTKNCDLHGFYQKGQINLSSTRCSRQSHVIGNFTYVI